MGKKHDLLVVVAVLLLIFLVGHTQSSRVLHRSSQVFKVMKPSSRSGHQKLHDSSFFAFLPKARPIPPSGPSRKHNAIGLQSSSQLSP
ncbi:protein IDA-LIKE 5-like [Pyrus ussuriensis x Pyrus communis]|uniref:Protein IDA-LIKE 5-like n=1 Tax=Pyrus ussuriensis x Pyrus communis TaxID=2448454 RepID=A0A5N5IBY0_9ROSA|nr:protein IDA-LIKE 5-like [Pyrus ussuriensis x Pyrus communis]